MQESFDIKVAWAPSSIYSPSSHSYGLSCPPYSLYSPPLTAEKLLKMPRTGRPRLLASPLDIIRVAEAPSVSWERRKETKGWFEGMV